MTNKEKYKQAFSVLHTSDISAGEVKYMAKLTKMCIRDRYYIHPDI